jgi:2-dehydro-3-deoxygalactonokinase
MATPPPPPALIVVDWGTTNFRCSLVAADGTALSTVQNDGGMKGIAAAGGGLLFERHLAAAIGEWLQAHHGLHVVMAGMVSERTGVGM